jgi:hypothetical protein
MGESVRMDTYTAEISINKLNANCNEKIYSI